MELMTIAYIIIAIGIGSYTVSVIMNFLGVDIQFYGSYLFWFIALVLFWGFLPGPTDYFAKSVLEK